MASSIPITHVHVLTRFYEPPVDRRTPPPARLREPASLRCRPTAADLIGAPRAGTVAFRAWSEWLGHRLAELGASAVEPHLAQFAAAALDRGVEPVLARLVADRTEPEVVRARAFAKVALAMERGALASSPGRRGPS